MVNWGIVMGRQLVYSDKKSNKFWNIEMDETKEMMGPR